MDGFESFADKMAANDPLLKLEGQNILDSPVMCALERNNWLEDKDFSTFVTSSLPGFEPPKSTGSINDVGLVAEELKIKHYRISSSGPDPDNDQRMLRVRGELKDMPSHTRSFKVLSSNHSEQEPDKLSAYLRDQESKIMSNNMLNIAKKKLKTQSNNSHSQLLVNETSKGKRLSKLGYDSEVDVNNDQFSSHGVGNSGPNSVRYGISLREWLIPGNHKVDIVESLLIFRQIVELVDFAHSQGVALQNLRPSRFMLLPSNKVKYTGSSTIRESSVSIINRDLIIKRPLEQDARAERISGGRPMKQSEAKAEIFCVAGPQNSGYGEGQFQTKSSYQNAVVAVQKRSISVIIQLEEKWYTSPEEHNERGCTLPSNIYGLGVLLFELLCRSESWELHSAMMLDLHHRVLPQKFLSQNPQEAGFCFWLLHPEPLSRPTTREILQSKMIGRYQDTASSAEFSNSVGNVDAESELLLNFLVSLKDKKQGHASKLVEDIRTLEEDINKFARRHLSGVSSDISWVHDEIPREREESLIPDSVSSGYSTDEKRLMKNIGQLEDAYASARSQLAQIEAAPVASSDNEVLNNRDRWCHMRNGTQDTSINRMKSGDRLGSFFDGFCKFSRHSKFEVCGTLRNGNLLNSSNVICCLSFDRGEEYIATAGVSKKIKIFDFGKLVDNSLDIHYPVVEIPNNSKLSCVCWNNYLKNYLASADYDGVVQMWDATTGQGFSQHVEHQKRAWSVDFSQSDPKVFASGSDDFSVKLWDINEKNSTSTIWNPANVCCVQFSAYSSNLLVFGSADYKIYGYDLRHTRIPWCTLPGHGKAVSYVKFIDSETLVSASTDNTLKLWDLNQSISTGLSSNACSRTFSGHTNQKNFVGLSVSDGYIACGSETNEVYSYHRSLPMPITSHKFGSIDPISGSEVIDYSGQFVSSVCWRRKSNMVVAANSSGTLKILQMV